MILSFLMSLLDDHDSTRVEVHPASPLVNVRFIAREGEATIRTNRHFAKILRDQLTEALEYKPT